MNSRMKIMMVALLIALGVIGALLIRGQKTAPPIAAATPAAPAVLPPLRIQIQTVAPQPVAAAVAPDPITTPVVLAPKAEAVIIKSDTGEKVGYTAIDGDTIANVAVGLLGADTKENRAQLIAANPSLQANPDRVLLGTTYFRTPQGSSAVATNVTTADTTAAASPQPQPANVQAAQPDATAAVPAAGDRVLKYTAKPGDSVSVLAAGLLGADTKTNRDAIVGQNQSLQNDPDHVVTGKTYTIPAGDGLAAAPASATSAQRPTTQPDADQVVQASQGRQLRYTALAGDNVSKLATALLGEDTQANRDAIINNNASLKSDPDRVVAGQTYWIPAPDAAAGKP